MTPQKGEVLTIFNMHILGYKKLVIDMKNVYYIDNYNCNAVLLFINGGPPADLLINQGVRDNVSGHTTRAPLIII